MRRTKLVLAALALMVAMVLAFSAPAMADNKGNNNDNKGNHHAKKSNNNNGNHHAKKNNNNRHNNFFDHRRNDADIIFVSDFDHDDFDDIDVEIDDDDLRFHHFGYNNFYGCWEWSWVFDRWEWECD